MNLRFTRAALTDLDGILDYIAQDSPQAADRMHRRIRTVFDLIARQPRIGVRTDDAAIRRVVVVPYPYLIFYEVTETDIIVHAVRHGARAP
jgi:plasmid stabilization system protein ParE